jgi:hypothetical protein
MKHLLLIAVHSVFLAVAATGQVATNAPSVTLSFKTTPSTGKYTPRHVLAIWVTDTQDTLIRTLRVEANKRKKHLVQWLAVAGSNAVDGVTGATRKAHESVKVTWDCKDTKGNPVPEGTYRIRIEFTEANGPGPATPKNHIAFTVGSQALSLKPEDLANFKEIALEYLPGEKKPAAKE